MQILLIKKKKANANFFKEKRWAFTLVLEGFEQLIKIHLKSTTSSSTVLNSKSQSKSKEAENKRI